MHVHASDRKLTEAGSAKFFVKKDGETTIENAGQLTEREIRMIWSRDQELLIMAHEVTKEDWRRNCSRKVLEVRGTNKEG